VFYEVPIEARDGNIHDLSLEIGRRRWTGPIELGQTMQFGKAADRVQDVQ